MQTKKIIKNIPPNQQQVLVWLMSVCIENSFVFFSRYVVIVLSENSSHARNFFLLVIGKNKFARGKTMSNLLSYYETSEKENK